MEFYLKQENLSIDYEVAEIPTGFIESYGSGNPIYTRKMRICSKFINPHIRVIFVCIEDDR